MSFSILVPLCLHFSISVCERTVVRGKPTIVVFQERAIQRRATPQGHRAEECLGRVLKWEAGGQWREAMPRNCFSEDTPEALWSLWSVRGLTSEGGRLHLHDGRCGGVCSVSRLWDIPRGNGVEESGDLSACWLLCWRAVSVTGKVVLITGSLLHGDGYLPLAGRSSSCFLEGS